MNNVFFKWSDFCSSPWINKEVQLIPVTSSVLISNSYINSFDYVSQPTDNDGYVIFNSLVACKYKVNFVGKSILTTFNILVPTSGDLTINGKDLIV